MSAYLNFYLKPKVKENCEANKPMMFLSICRSSQLYEAFESYIAWSDSGEEYTKVTSDIISNIVSDAKKEIDDWKMRMDELEKHAAGNIDIIDEIISGKKYLEELQTTYTELCFIQNMVYDLKEDYYDFECLLMNRN